MSRRPSSFPVADEATLEWLLEGDPAIRWQVMRDLLDAPEEEWRAEQAKVSGEGWGAELLSHRDGEGRWTPRFYGKKWLSTTYTLLLLRDMGLPRDDQRARQSCLIILDEGQWEDGGIRTSDVRGNSETCVSGMVHGLLDWFQVDDPRREHLAEYLRREQMADGGWNCQRFDGATHASFHTTINVLEGLDSHAGREFLLAHRLFRSHRTGEVVHPQFLRMSFPPRWHYDVLRALDHFQRVAADPTDERLSDALDVLRDKRGKDGRWPLQGKHAGAVWFEMEQGRQPSRWNTLRALRVLRWAAANRT